MWKNIRIESDYTNNQVVFCIDNEVAYTATNVTFSTSGSKMAYFYHYYSAYGGQIMSFDNVYLGYTEDATAAS